MNRRLAFAYIAAASLSIGLISPGAFAQVTTLRCEGKEALPEPAAKNPMVKFSGSFDEKRKVLTFNGRTYDRETSFSPEEIYGKAFAALPNDPKIGQEYSLLINHVTSEFHFSWIPSSVDGSELDSDQIVRAHGRNKLFLFTGSCEKVKAAF